jgi:hypothetical protein
MKAAGLNCLLFAVFAVLAVISAVYSYLSRQKRRRELWEFAGSAGLEYSYSDTLGISHAYPYFSCLCKGDNRYAFNVISGKYNGRDVIWFDYHYQTYSTDSKGHRTTHHHYFSAEILPLGFYSKSLFIRRENILDKLGEVVGLDDIDFESHEFSKRFFVKAADRKFAYAVIHPKMMEFLMNSPVFCIQMTANSVIFYKDSIFPVAQIKQALDTGCRFVELIPEYLVKELKST